MRCRVFKSFCQLFYAVVVQSDINLFWSPIYLPNGSEILTTYKYLKKDTLEKSLILKYRYRKKSHDCVHLNHLTTVNFHYQETKIFSLANYS